MIDHLIPIKARHATKLEITRFHTEEYHDRIQRESNLNGGDGGELCRFAAGAYEIAALAAGGVFAAVSETIFTVTFYSRSYHNEPFFLYFSLSARCNH